MSYSLKLCPTHFSAGGKSFPRVFAHPCVSPSCIQGLHSISVFTVVLTCFNVENVRAPTHVLYVFPNVQRIFSAKSFSLGNLFLLTNVQKFFTVSNTVSIVAQIFIKRCYACSTVITITHCRDGQLIWLKGHFEKVTFN